MIVELRGVEFVNKGAELMMHSIISKVKEWNSDVKFVMESSPRSPRDKHREYGIYTKAKYKKYRVNFDPLISLIPGKILAKYAMVKERDVQVVLDGSGFAFGDQWGEKKAGIRLADHIKKWKNQGKVIVVLPQAFGPFTNSGLIGKMKDIGTYADVVFARDEISFKYLKEIVGDRNNVMLRPDFTNIMRSQLPESFDKTILEVAIIPNSKMIETSSPEDGEIYIKLLERTAKHIQSLGKKPFFLIHESVMDIKIARQVNEALQSPIPVLQEENPLNVKGIIGNSQAVITSRFHGLVSCLAQGIPCLATGWSHKYEMLLKDYDYPEALLDIHISDDDLLTSLKSILNEPKKSAIHDKLKNEAVKQKIATEEMWRIVFDVIASKIKK